MSFGEGNLHERVDGLERQIAALTERTRRLAWCERKLSEVEDESERLRRRLADMCGADSIELVVDELHHGTISPARAVERLGRLFALGGKREGGGR